VVIDDFYVTSISFLPGKADPVLIIDADAVLALAVALQGLQPVPWRHTQIIEASGALQIQQFATRNTFKRPKPRYIAVVEQRLGVPTAERTDHVRSGYYASRNMSNDYDIAATITVHISNFISDLAVNGQWHVVVVCRSVEKLKNND
jgi:hypothetical protein